MDDTPDQVSTLSGRFLEKFEKRGPWNHTHATLATATPCNATTNQQGPIDAPCPPPRPTEPRDEEALLSPDKTSPPQGKKKGGGRRGV